MVSANYSEKLSSNGYSEASGTVSVKQSRCSKLTQQIKSSVSQNTASYVGGLCGSKMAEQAVSIASTIAEIALPALCSISQYTGNNPLARATVLSAEILGSFVGLNLTGSKEPLLNREDPLNCYVTKSLQYYAATAAAQYVLNSELGIVGTATTLALGSMAYNAVDIWNLASSIANSVVKQQA